MEQLSACGLKAIKQQLLFRKLINNQPMSVEVNDQGGSQVVNAVSQKKRIKEYIKYGHAHSYVQCNY